MVKGENKFQNEAANFGYLETIHDNAVLSADFHKKISEATLWRFCVYCGAKIERGVTS